MSPDFRFKKEPEIKEVELKPQKIVDDITHLAYFTCPACNHMGMLAYGESAVETEKEDWCVYCGQKVSYKIPAFSNSKKQGGTII